MSIYKFTPRGYRQRENSKRFARNWQDYLIAADSYRDGYKAALADLSSALGKEVVDNIISEQDKITVDVEFFEGEHQLSSATFTKWENMRKTISLEDHLKGDTYFEFSDVRFFEQGGVISFQGKARRNP